MTSVSANCILIASPGSRNENEREREKDIARIIGDAFLFRDAANPFVETLKRSDDNSGSGVQLFQSSEMIERLRLAKDSQ